MNPKTQDLLATLRRVGRWTPRYAWIRMNRRRSTTRWQSRNSTEGFLIRPSLEHMVVEHCNLACKGCNKASPELPGKFSSLDRFTADIRALSTVMRSGVFKLTGGEPLLHPQIAGFAKAVKDSGLAREVELWTNGLILHKVKDEVLEHVDVIHITRYPGVDIALTRAAMSSMARRHGVRFEVTYRPTFMEMDLDTPNHEPERNREVFRRCKLAHEWSCHSIQEGHYFKCSRAHILRLRPGDPLSVDGVPLHAPDLRDRLAAYLRSRTPLAVCAWCLGSSGPTFAHEQMSRPERVRGALRWRPPVEEPPVARST